MTHRSAELRNDDGFTLVELLVSLSLLVVMLALVNGALSFGRRAWEVSEDIERTQSVTTIRTLLGQRLAEALPLTGWDDQGALRPTFHGSGDQLTFLTAMPSRNGLSAGLFSVSLKLMSAPGLAGRPLAIELSAVVGANAPERGSQANLLIDNVTQLAIRYYGTPERSAEPKWFDEWQGQTTLPRMVGVDVQFAPGDPRAWPPLTTELKLGARERSGR